MRNDVEYILCAAIRRRKPRECIPYREGMNDICGIEIGYRHHDILQRFGKEELEADKQGFYTSRGRFVDRKEAYRIAVEAGQVRGKEKMLFSEDLY